MSTKEETTEQVTTTGLYITKEQPIPSDEDILNGADRAIPLEQLRNSVTLQLALPIEKDGGEVTEIDIHPPKTIDVKRWRSKPNPAQAIDEFMVKCLKHWAPSDLEILEPYDYLRVQKLVMHYL